MRSYEVVRVYPTPKGIITCIYHRFEKQEGAKRETLLFRPPLRKEDSAHGKAHSCKQTMSLLIRISDSLRFPEMEIKEVFEALLISLLMSVNPFSSIHFCKHFFTSAATQLREISAQVMFCTMFNPWTSTFRYIQNLKKGERKHGHLNMQFPKHLRWSGNCISHGQTTTIHSSFRCTKSWNLTLISTGLPSVYPKVPSKTRGDPP